MHQAAGFKREGNLVYKLRRSVYGLRQSPRNFFHYLSDKLQNKGLKPSKLDPCLFIGDTVIVVIYVDDVLLYSKSADAIDSLLDNLQAAGVGIRKEGTAEGFLGVDISRAISASGPTITLLQRGLAKRIVEALGLCSQNTTAISTPAEASPLPKDVDGEPASGTFNYAAVVGIMFYLSGHSRPDIAFAVHQCDRYMFKPTRRHELALIRIGRYLKGTLDK
jgi:histone deacetylase 1/2